MYKKILLITMVINTTVQENVKDNIIQQQNFEKNSKQVTQNNVFHSTKNTFNLKKTATK